MVEIYHAAAAQPAFQIIKEQKPGVVILDFDLPVKLFAIIIKYLKKNYVNTFNIVLSNQSDSNIKTQCHLVGANVFLDRYHEFDKIQGIIKEFALDIN